MYVYTYFTFFFFLYHLHANSYKIGLYGILFSNDNTSYCKSCPFFQQKIPVNGKLGVVSRGSGVARMDVEVRYNVNVTEGDMCQFSVEVFDKPVKLDLLQEKGFTPDE